VSRQQSLVSSATIVNIRSRSDVPFRSELPRAAEKMAPGDWQHRNIQIVIQTTIINDNVGEPRAVAAYVW